MPKLDPNAIRTALSSFRQKFPKPDRASAIELLRVSGFSYKDSSDRVDIYKSAQFPGRPVTINKGTHVHEGMAQAIASLIDQILAGLPAQKKEGGTDADT